jgi:hypothetical protein
MGLAFDLGRVLQYLGYLLFAQLFYMIAYLRNGMLAYGLFIFHLGSIFNQSQKYYKRSNLNIHLLTIIFKYLIVVCVNFFFKFLAMTHVIFVFVVIRVEYQLKPVNVEKIVVNEVGRSFGDFLVGLKDSIQAKSEHILEHTRNEALQDWACELQAGVGIDFKQPWLKIAVDEEVEAKQLKSVIDGMRLNLGMNGSNGLSGN